MEDEQEKRKAIRTAIMRACDAPLYKCDAVLLETLQEFHYEITSSKDDRDK